MYAPTCVEGQTDEKSEIVTYELKEKLLTTHRNFFK